MKRHGIREIVLKTVKAGSLHALFAIALLAALSAVPRRALAAQEQAAQEQTVAQASQEASPTAKPEPGKEKEEDRAVRENKGPGGQLVEETRESTGADEEEHADLKHSGMVRLLARKTGLSVHQAHLVALGLNFAIIVAIVFWAGRKTLPGMLRSRNASIQRALEEARAASQDANRRLLEIENRLRRLDVEIGQMQATAEKEAEAEEGRIQKAAEEEMRKVVLAAEQEIATAAKQARRELTNHTAGLAISLARQQINVDSNTDQVLVKNFASKLASWNNDGGKDGQ
jgi:F-type H+-transporting ATPase subunit b